MKIPLRIALATAVLASLLSAQIPAAPPATRPHTLTGDFRTISAFPSKFLSAPRDIVIYLPPEYGQQASKRYPVLYLQDGQNLFDGATSFIPGKEWQVDETAERLIRSRQIEPLIIVGIYNVGSTRIDEYTPSADEEYHRGGQAERYGRMLIEELKPFIDSHYRTLPDPQHTAIGGSSLGALVSLYLALRHPDVFGKVAAMSPSIWWNHRAIIDTLNGLEHKPNLKIWLDTGTAEGQHPDAVIADARTLHGALLAKGFHEGGDLAYLEVPGAEHTETAWAARMEKVLRFLFAAEK